MLGTDENSAAAAVYSFFKMKISAMSRASRDGNFFASVHILLTLGRFWPKDRKIYILN